MTQTLANLHNFYRVLFHTVPFQIPTRILQGKGVLGCSWFFRLRYTMKNILWILKKVSQDFCT